MVRHLRIEGGESPQVLGKMEGGVISLYLFMRSGQQQRRRTVRCRPDSRTALHDKTSLITEYRFSNDQDGG